MHPRGEHGEDEDGDEDGVALRCRLLIHGSPLCDSGTRERLWSLRGSHSQVWDYLLVRPAPVVAVRRLVRLVADGRDVLGLATVAVFTFVILAHKNEVAARLPRRNLRPVVVEAPPDGDERIPPYAMRIDVHHVLSDFVDSFHHCLAFCGSVAAQKRPTTSLPQVY